MAMSRKDYVAVARILRAQYATGNLERQVVAEEIAAELSAIFAEDNLRFDSGKFMDAVRTGKGL